MVIQYGGKMTDSKSVPPGHEKSGRPEKIGQSEPLFRRQNDPLQTFKQQNERRLSRLPVR